MGLKPALSVGESKMLPLSHAVVAWLVLMVKTLVHQSVQANKSEGAGRWVIRDRQVIRLTVERGSMVDVAPQV